MRISQNQEATDDPDTDIGKRIIYLKKERGQENGIRK